MGKLINWDTDLGRYDDDYDTKIWDSLPYAAEYFRTETGKWEIVSRERGKLIAFDQEFQEPPIAEDKYLWKKIKTGKYNENLSVKTLKKDPDKGAENDDKEDD